MHNIMVIGAGNPVGMAFTSGLIELPAVKQCAQDIPPQVRIYLADVAIHRAMVVELRSACIKFLKLGITAGAVFPLLDPIGESAPTFRACAEVERAISQGHNPPWLDAVVVAINESDPVIITQWVVLLDFMLKEHLKPTTTMLLLHVGEEFALRTYCRLPLVEAVQMVLPQRSGVDLDITSALLRFNVCLDW